MPLPLLPAPFICNFRQNSALPANPQARQAQEARESESLRRQYVVGVSETEVHKRLQSLVQTLLQTVRGIQTFKVRLAGRR